MKSRLRIAAVCASVLSLCLFFGCPMPVTPPARGSLTITVADHVSRTLLPAISMDVASYSVSGAGPNGASFSQSTSSGSLTLSTLAFGTWTVTVNALNSDGTLIGQGFGTAEVHTGSTTTVAITVTPLSGSGTLTLSVSWPGSQVESPSVQATLLAPDGTLTPLPFSVSGSQVSFSSAAIPAGYQTLTLQVLDNGVLVAGAVEVVRIAAGQTTSGSYAFANVNQPGGALQVNITPAMADPIPLAIAGVGATLIAESSMTATASTTDGTTGVTYVWYLNGSNVGTGPSLTFGSALAVGYYRLDVTGFTADGTRGGSANASFQVNAGHASAGRYVYLANYGSSTVSGYTVGSDGLLTALSAPSLVAQGNPYGIAITPNGSFLYVTNYNSRTVSGFAIAAGGLLTPLSTPAFPAGSGPFGVALTPNGCFLYVTNYLDSTLSGYAISHDGQLTPLSTPAFATGLQPCGIAVAPNGSFLYVTNYNQCTVSGYAIGPDGLLSPLGTPQFAPGSEPFGVVVTPNGSFLYVTNAGAHTISGFAIGSGGLLTPLSTPTFGAGGFPNGIAVTPDGSYLYATNATGNTVSGYSVGADGLLTPLGTPVFATGKYPIQVAVTPNGAFLYVTNYDFISSSLSAYAIGSGGLLVPLSTYAFTFGTSPFGIAFAP